MQSNLSGSRTAASAPRTGELMARSLAEPGHSEELLTNVARDLATASRAVAEMAKVVAGGASVTAALVQAPARMMPEVVTSGTATVKLTLRQRGELLLERSRDVWHEDHIHPAYSRILDELAPDEARILLLLYRGGPQPSVDVRTGGLIGRLHDELIAGGLNMIGPRAGCRYLDSVPAFLDNLHRLGLIWFSREQLDDHLEYQVVEAQPDVLAAMHSVRKFKLVRRSIALTPFGMDFSAKCLVDSDAPSPLRALLGRLR